MVTINEISYEDERLEFFAEQQRILQRRYDKLKNQIRPDEPYLSERRQLLDDCGRELSFCNDVIEMLKNNVVPKRIFEVYRRLNDELEQELAATYDKLEEAESKVAEKIFDEIENALSDNFHADCQMGDCIEDYYDDNLRDDIAELKKKYATK